MIVPVGQIKFLKKNQPQTVMVTRDSWPHAKPPKLMSVYIVKAPADATDPPKAFKATAVAVGKTVEGWAVTLRRGDLRDQPKLLRAAPGGPPPPHKPVGTGWDARRLEDIPPPRGGGGDAGDYTTQPAMAMRDEPEAVSESVAARFARSAAVEDAASRDRLLREARQHIDRGVEILQGLGSTPKRAADSIRHYADKIAPQDEDRAA